MNSANNKFSLFCHSNSDVEKNGYSKGMCESVFVSSAIESHSIEEKEIVPYSTVVSGLKNVQLPFKNSEKKMKIMAALGLMYRSESEDLEGKQCPYRRTTFFRLLRSSNIKNKTRQCPKSDKVSSSSFNKKSNPRTFSKITTLEVQNQEADQKTPKEASTTENEDIENVTTVVSELGNAETGVAKELQETLKIKEMEIIRATKDKRHNCPECPNAYIYRSGMIRHLKTHTVENRKKRLNSTGSFLSKQAFQCNICAKIFATKYALISHKGWHKRQKIYEKNSHNCDHCEEETH